MTLIPWQAGKNIIWDVTVADSLADSYLPFTSKRSGSAAESAFDKKMTKYSALIQSYIFTPITFEALGPISSKASEFLCGQGRRITSVTGDPRESSHLFQMAAGGYAALQLHMF